MRVHQEVIMISFNNESAVIWFDYLVLLELIKVGDSIEQGLHPLLVLSGRNNHDIEARLHSIIPFVLSTTGESLLLGDNFNIIFMQFPFFLIKDYVRQDMVCSFIIFGEVRAKLIQI